MPPFIRRGSVSAGTVFRSWLRIVVIVAILCLLLAFALHMPTPTPFPTPSTHSGAMFNKPINILQNVEDSGPHPDTPVDRLLEHDVTDAVLRGALAHVESGSTDPVTIVAYDYPDTLRLGDEGELHLRIQSYNSRDLQLRLEMAGNGLVPTPAVFGPFEIRGAVAREVPIVLGATSEGAKTLVLTGTLLPSREALNSGVVRVTVLPRVTVFGIPEPYGRFLQIIVSSI